MNLRRTCRGFSLVELAVVLAIISLVAGAGIGLGSNAMKGSEKVATQEKLALIKKALNQFAQQNGYLPCPADRALAPTSANFGAEARNAASAYTVPASNCAYSGSASVVAGVALSSSTYIGMVPIRTLGLPDSYAGDAWGNKFTYAVASSMIANPGSYNTALSAGPVVRYGDLTTYQVAYRAAAGSGTPGTGYAAFVVASHGPSGVGAYSIDGSSASGTCGSTTADAENCDDDNIFAETIYSDGSQSTQFYDDYIVWGTNLRGLAPRTVSTNVYGTTPASCSDVTASTPYCEAWCAPCTSNTPSVVAPSTDNVTLCSKTVNATSSSCQAICVWGGYVASGTKYQPCP